MGERVPHPLGVCSASILYTGRKIVPYSMIIGASILAPSALDLPPNESPGSASISCSLRSPFC